MNQKNDLDSLWTNIQQGCERSFRMLYRMFHPELKSYAYYLLGDNHLAGGTVNDTFMKVLDNRETISSKDGSIKNLLYRVTHRLCLNALKKNKTQKTGVFSLISSEEWINLFEKHGDDNCIIEKMEMDELTEAINKVVEKMPEQRREVFRLSSVEGLANKEIAEQMGIAESTVRTHFQHARKEIEDFLKSI